MHVISAGGNHVVLKFDHPPGPLAAGVQILLVARHVISGAERAHGVGIHEERAGAVRVADLGAGQSAKLKEPAAKIGGAASCARADGRSSAASNARAGRREKTGRTAQVLKTGCSLSAGNCFGVGI